MSRLNKANGQYDLRLYRGDIVYCDEISRGLYNGFNQRSTDNLRWHEEVEGPLRGFFGIVQGAGWDSEYPRYLVTILGGAGHGVFVYVEGYKLSPINNHEASLQLAGLIDHSPPVYQIGSLKGKKRLLNFDLRYDGYQHGNYKWSVVSHEWTKDADIALNFAEDEVFGLCNHEDGISLERVASLVGDGIVVRKPPEKR